MKKRLVGLGIIALMFCSVVGANAAIMNVATSGSATQSSTGVFTSGIGYASNAIDGDTNGIWNYTTDSDQTISHTSYDYQAWWQVELDQVYEIDELVLWNRTDHGLQYRLDHFDITIFNTITNTTVWSSLNNRDFQSSFSVNLSSSGVSGNLVKIQLQGTNYLHLAEVQVFADTDPVPEPTTMLLFGTGLIGLVGSRLRKKKK